MSNSEIPIKNYGVLFQDSPASELDEVAEQVKRIGYAIIDSGYSTNELEELSAAFTRTRTAYVKKYGEERLRSANEYHTIRAPLIHGDPVFVKLATNQNLLKVISKIIAGKFILNQQNGVINPPCETYNQGAWHRDLPYQHFISNSPLALNALFCLDEFTLQNGSTYVLPASHKTVNFPSDSYIKQHALQVQAKAGQYVLMDCMLFHTGGFNSTVRERRAVNHMYTIPHIRPQIDISRNLNINKFTNNEIDILGLNFRTSLSVDEYLNFSESKNARK
jgi:ectoine hydroxylase-related dioxygenase (phytanoyl-CoA dioxygenase family)